MAIVVRRVWVICLCLSVSSVAEAQRQKRGEKADAKRPVAAKSFPKDALSAALVKAGQSAVQAELQHLLVVVRDNPRNETEIDRTELLARYRQRMIEQFRNLKLVANESSQIEKLANLTRPSSSLRVTDVRVFQKFAKLDAVLDVMVSQRGPANRLSMTLLTDKTKLWSGTVAAPAVKQQKAADGNGEKPTVGHGQAARIPRLNRRVLQFALSQMGRKVGNGECWTLAAQALVRSGARPANLFNFGKQIPLAQIQPGDILQFKSARFEFGNSYYYFGAPDHTVIVMGVEGSKVSILHQNFGKKIVTTLTIDFKQMTKGKVWAWRPVPR